MFHHLWRHPVMVSCWVMEDRYRLNTKLMGQVLLLKLHFCIMTLFWPFSCLPLVSSLNLAASLNSGYVCCLQSWATSLESFTPFMPSQRIDESFPGGDGKALKYPVSYFVVE
ncbi:Uncharacterized protein Adt_17373 [Abeliophyllum distichum]|uniref:Uncharacterized protein n=1 Tax=Abeliophyllum distichum TaxID=126358 RepID=A0ABD1TGU1_9LAMI